MRLSRIGQYYVEKQIAIGGQARIFQCLKDSQVFAIKVYNQHDDQKDKLFSQQKQLIESLEHSAILSPEQYIPHETIITQDHQVVKKNVVIMKYMKNGDLMDYVTKNGRLNEKVILKMVRSILKCLIYLRDREVCHCDIKPQNILLNQSFQPILIDFGFILSRLSTKDKSFPQQYHIAPQVKKGLPYSQKSEAFSLGVLIFFLAMGCPPFKQTKHTDPSYRSLLQGKHQIFWKHYEQELKFSLSQKLKNTIVNLIEPNPKRRWSYSNLSESEWLSEDPLSQAEYRQYFLLRQPTKIKNEKLMYEFPFTDNEQTASKSFLEQNS